MALIAIAFTGLFLTVYDTLNRVDLDQRLVAGQPLGHPGRRACLLAGGRVVPEVPAGAEHDPWRLRRGAQGDRPEGRLPDISGCAGVVVVLDPVRGEHRARRPDHGAGPADLDVVPRAAQRAAQPCARLRRGRAGLRPERRDRKPAIHGGIRHRIPRRRGLGAQLPDVEPARGRHRLQLLRRPATDLVRLVRRLSAADHARNVVLHLGTGPGGDRRGGRDRRRA